MRVMRQILHNHPFACATVLFIALMAGLKLVATSAVGHFGPWIAIPIIGAFLAVAFWIEQRDRQREG